MNNIPKTRTTTEPLMTPPSFPRPPAPSAGEILAAPVEYPDLSYYCPYCGNAFRVIRPSKDESRTAAGIIAPPIVTCPFCGEAAFRLNKCDRTILEFFRELAEDVRDIILPLLKEHADMQEKCT